MTALPIPEPSPTPPELVELAIKAMRVQTRGWSPEESAPVFCEIVRMLVQYEIKDTLRAFVQTIVNDKDVKRALEELLANLGVERT